MAKKQVKIIAGVGDQTDRVKEMIKDADSKLAKNKEKARKKREQAPQDGGGDANREHDDDDEEIEEGDLAAIKRKFRRGK